VLPQPANYTISMANSKILPAFIALAMQFGCSGATLPRPGPLRSPLGFPGQWDSNWGELKLVQQATHVHGNFNGFRNGWLSGYAQGDLLIFRWHQVEPKQEGKGYFRLTSDGQLIDGKWGYGPDHLQGGRWWAKRVVRDPLVEE
jgi:hypothetical protein